MPHSVNLIHTIAAALGLALALGFVATRLRLPALVGYLLAGVVIGPFTPGFVADAAMARTPWRRVRGLAACPAGQGKDVLVGWVIG